MSRHHGAWVRDITAPRSRFFQGPFGRLFRNLPPWVPAGDTDSQIRDALEILAKRMIETQKHSKSPEGDNPDI